MKSTCFLDIFRQKR